MDRTTLITSLQETERRIGENAQRIARQRRIVQQMIESGWDATLARDLLMLFERSQTAQMTARDTLRARLALLAPPAGPD